MANNVKTKNGHLVREITVAEGYCNDCDDELGPDIAENVGFDITVEHEGHDVEYDDWTEEENIECSVCGAPATHLEEINMGLGDTSSVPYCNGCGYDDRRT